MKAQRNALIVSVLFAALAVGLAATAAQAQGGKPEVKSAEAFGIVWEHGNGNGNGRKPRGGSSPNLVNHGGPVQTGTTQVYPIYWGSSWAPGDKTTGLDSFYGNVGTSNYVKTNSEYGASTDVQLAKDVTDPSAAPSRAPSTADVFNEVLKMYGSNLVAGAYYPVYSDQPRGSAGYCAWHSYGTYGSTEVQIAFFFNLDNDPGCNPQSPPNGHDPGTQALVNVSGHELSEMLTDPQLNAWYDNSGSENADKCAWTFGRYMLPIGNDSWKIQGNWSNNASNTGTGYYDPSRGSVVQGCVDGTNGS